MELTNQTNYGVQITHINAEYRKDRDSLFPRFANVDTFQVRKYRNRKLYLVNSASYIHYGHIQEILKNGKQVTVEDMVTGKDITTESLSYLASRLFNQKMARLSNNEIAEQIRASSAQ